MIGRGDPNNCEACQTNGGDLCHDHKARLRSHAEFIGELLEDFDAGVPLAVPKRMERVA